MEKYIVILSDKKQGNLNDYLLNKHVSHLRKLASAGSLFLCGPFQDNDGALQILLANSKEEATEMVNNDPFIKEGYYQNYTMHELIEGNEENNYLLDDAQTNINKKLNNTK